MTGAELAALEHPARSIGIVSSAKVEAECDVVLRHVGEAIADYVIPDTELNRIAQASALIVLVAGSTGTAGRPATAILEDAERRHADGTVDEAFGDLRRRDGEQRVETLMAELLSVGRAVFGALEDLYVPDEAANELALAIAGIADHKSGARR
jgi:hypothetical protein